MADKDTKKDLSDKGKKVVDLVKEMNVMEVSDLVKYLEEEWGVTSSAPVMMAGAMSAQANSDEEKAEEKSAYDVVLKSAGAQKIAVIKVIKELNPNLGLVEAKNLSEKADSVILAGAKKEDAEAALEKLKTAGATAELK